MSPSANPTPVVYVPAPLPNPLAFDEVAPPRPRRKREREPDEPERGGNRGLLIKLAILGAVGMVGVAWVVVCEARDIGRLTNLRAEIRAAVSDRAALIGERPNLDGLGLDEYRRAMKEWESREDGPEAKRRAAKIAALAQEYYAIAARHPDWRVMPPLDD